MIWVILIISLILSVIIVNKAYQLYMKAIGADGMFYSGKKKLIAIAVVALLIAAIVMQIFGIEIPR